MNIAKLVKAIKRQDTIIEARREAWLLQHGDDALPPWVVAIIANILATQPRVRSGSFSGSAAGMCLRRQELAYAGVIPEPVDAQTQAIFTDGKYRHLRWQAELLTMGALTHIEYLVQWKRKWSRGALDGRGEVPMDHAVTRWRGLEFGFELKGVSTFQFQKYKYDGPERKHLLQVHHYFVLGNFDLFVIIYEDKTTQETKEWVIEPDPVLLAEAQADIDALALSVENKTLDPQLPECAQRKGLWSDCPYGKNGKCQQAISVPASPYVHSQ